jgi:hypothetical protein
MGSGQTTFMSGVRLPSAPSPPAVVFIEHAIRNGHVPKSAVRFRAAHDATGALPTMVLESVEKRLEAAVD